MLIQVTIRDTTLFFSDFFSFQLAEFKQLFYLNVGYKLIYHVIQTNILVQ